MDSDNVFTFDNLYTYYDLPTHNVTTIDSYNSVYNNIVETFEKAVNVRVISTDNWFSFIWWS